MPVRSVVASVAEAQLLEPLRWVHLPGSDRKQELVFAFLEGYADVDNLLLHDRH